MTNHLLLNENTWFKQNQGLLLQMANTDFGRDLLCIPKDYPRIIAIRKNGVRAYHGIQDGKHHYVTDFRIGSKWGNVIRARFEQFNSYARYFVAKDNLNPVFSPLTRYARTVCATTTTAFPDPDPGATTVDGRVLRDVGGGGENISTITTSAGNIANSGLTNIEIGLFTGAATSVNQFADCVRGIYLFDTSGIPDSDVISATTLSLYVESKDDQMSGASSANSQLIVVATTPAANTTLAASDYGQFAGTSFGTSQNQSAVATSAYEVINFNASGIAAVSKTGVTKLGVKIGWDFNGVITGLTWGGSKTQGYVITDADTALTTQDPKLIVTSASPAVTYKYAPMLLVG